MIAHNNHPCNWNAQHKRSHVSMFNGRSRITCTISISMPDLGTNNMIINIQHLTQGLDGAREHHSNATFHARPS